MKGFKVIGWFILFLILQIDINGQSGGTGNNSFLSLPVSARNTALGSYTIALNDNDVSLVQANPASINSSMRNQLSLNHNFHFADITYGHVAYGFNIDTSVWTFVIGASYINYGNFVRTDAIGNIQGEFSGRQNALVISSSRKLDERLTFGASIRVINTSFDSYGNFAIGGDLGFQFVSPKNRTIWAFAIKNLGYQVSGEDELNESFKIDVQIGFSKRLEHLPFRFMVTMHDLQRWDLRDENALNTDPIFVNQFNSEQSQFSLFLDNFFRHLTFGGELSIGANENVQLRFAYDHLRNKELSVSGFRSFSGFSFGLGFKVKKIQFDYALSRYHLAGSANHLSLRVNLENLFNKI